jgi:hypothetical protein
MSAMGVLGPLASSVGCYNDGPITLNIILHGLFVIDIDDDGIQLLTPDTPGHIYRYGNWDARKIWSLDTKKIWELKGASSSNSPVPSDPYMVALSKSDSQCAFTVRREKAKVHVKLPRPSAMKFLRKCGDGRAVSCVDPNNGSGRRTVEVYSLSLCQVLVYNVDDSRQLRLEGSPWKPWIGHKSHTANLHFWAEPAKRLTPSHAYMAYATLSSILDPLDFKLSLDESAPVDEMSTVPGLPREQEQGWSEWASGGADGTHPTNCCSVITK